MSVSGASAVLGAAAGIAVAALAAAAAQPVDLTRPTPELPPAGPPREAPPRPDAPLRAQKPLDRAGIVVDVLETLSPDGFGPLDERGGGLPATLWQGVGWNVVRSLLPRVPGRTASAAMRALASRLLLSRAIAPAGKPEGESYLGLRADRLLAMADISNALALMAAVPERNQDEAFLKTRLEALFLDNRSGEACAGAARAGAAHRGVYWKQVEAFCLALDGRHPRAALISDLLREREEGIEPAYFAAMDALAGLGTAGIDSIGRPSGLLLAMTRAASLQVPSAIAESGSPLVLRWAARAPNVDLDARLAAAEKALALGAVTPEDVLAFHAELPFLDREMNDPVAQARAGWGPRGRALLLRAAAGRETAAERAETLRQGWDIAREAGGGDELSRAAVAVVATIEPLPELVWFARSAARPLFAAGRVDAALAWYGTARAERGGSEEAEAAENDLWPLALLAGGGDDAGLLERLATRAAAAEGSAEDAARVAALMTLVEANGAEFPPEAWRRLLVGPLVSERPGPGPAWRRSLEAAAAAGRVGETVLLALAAATAADGRAYERSATAAAAVRALRLAGLAEEARRLALESAMATGL